MVTVSISTRAIYEIDELAEFLGAQSPAYGRQFVDVLFKRIAALENLPFIGRIVPELADPTIRELVHRQYRIVYRVVSDSRLDVVSVQSTTRPLQDIS